MSMHLYFFPFQTTNCTVAGKNGWFFYRILPEWLYSNIWEVERDVDWANQALNSDKKGTMAFTLQHYYPKGIHFQQGWKSIDPKTNDASMSYTEAFKHLDEDDPVNTTLYIFGHCGAGQDKLWSPNAQESCSVEQLIGYLSTVPETFPGKIKLHGCESAVPGQLSKNQSFAQSFYEKFVAAGFKNVKVYGYTNNIANFHTKMPDGSVHKHSLNPQTGNLERNSQNRIPINSAVKIQ